MSFLSIDVGSSRCKAAIFSSSGEMLAMRSAVYAPHCRRPGFAELNADTFLHVVIKLARELACIPLPEAVQAVCFSSHGETVIPVSAAGQALGPAILNMDMRAVGEAVWIEDAMGRRQLFMLTGHTSHAMYSMPKILWLRSHAPEIFNAARSFLNVTSYLLLQLGLPPCVDFSHASRFLAFDVKRRIWSSALLDLVRIAPELLPVPVQAGRVTGKLDSNAAAMLGVAPGTPVVVGGHDQVIGAVGLGVIESGRAAGSLGTYECITVASDQLLLNDAALNASLNSYPGVVPGQFVTIAYFPGGIMMQWLGNLLHGSAKSEEEHHFEDLELAAPAGPTGLLITPHLIGSCNPEFDAQVRGAISGLNFDSTRSHLYKGILEGIAAELAIIIECLEAAGSTFRDLNVFGGGVRSALGLRLRAAFTQKQLHIMSCQESVCLGGAMLASVAVGIHSDLKSAAQAMVREQECVPPDPLLAEEYLPQIEGYRHFRSMLVHRPHHNNPDTGE
ncbi:MAG: FGGY-family carbohydrate kinase [Terracidiphilus sp.]